MQKAPSRKKQIHECFKEQGKEAATDLGRSLKLKESTLRQWMSTWRNQRHNNDGGAPRTDAATSSSLKTRLGPDGRIVLPAPFREALGLKESDVLFARLENGEIHLLTPKAAMRRAQAIVRRFVPEGVSLVDELIEDRRREVEREFEDG